MTTDVIFPLWVSAQFATLDKLSFIFNFFIFVVETPINRKSANWILNERI